MAEREAINVTGHARIDGVVPGVRGQRAFPVSGRGPLDPFVMLDHIGPDVLPDGFFVDGVMHPHRGFETLTIMFEGMMHHVDSTGFREELVTGSTQNMKAGRGIQHGGSMEADPDSHVFHEVQLWVTTPAAQKMLPPEIHSAHTADKPHVTVGDVGVEVITGTFAGETSPLSTTQPTRVLRLHSDTGGSIVVDAVPADWNVAVYALRGSATVADVRLDQFSTAVLAGDGDQVRIELQPGAELLFLSGEPTDEPIVLGGPWVMNTREEIEQADADFAAGRI